jgi:hypothetical protein
MAVPEVERAERLWPDLVPLLFFPHIEDEHVSEMGADEKLR